jgi:hypothetical protein
MGFIAGGSEKRPRSPLKSWLAGAATILFGALPATLLAGFMFLGGAFGLAGLFTGEPLLGGALLTSSACGAVGIYGLWVAAWPTRKSSTAIALAIGLVGLIGANLLLWAPSHFARITWLKVWLLWGPGVVGAYHIVRIVFEASLKRRTHTH